MKNEQDKDKIDDIFKKRLEDPARQFSYNDEDWDALEQMLDKDKKPRRIMWLPIISSIAAMLLLIFGWWFFKPAVVVNKPVKQQVAVKQVPNAMPDTTARSQQQEAVNTAPDTIKEHTKKLRDANPQEGIAPKTQFNNLANTDTGKPGKNNGLIFNPPANAGNAQGKTINDSSPALAKVNPPAVTKNASPDTSGKRGVITKDNDTQQIAANAAPEKAVTAAPETNKAPKKKITKSFAGRPQFAIGVIASSDLNGVNSFGSESKLGSNFGVQLSVGIKKFTISTGAIYSIKPYATGFQNYTTAYNFKEDPISVTADCRMIDIPINVGYQVYKKQRNKISVGTGLSSYFMLYEKYKYTYSTPNAGPQSYQVKNSKNYLLSIANVNVNFERQLNSKMSLSVQPYMKIPLAAVGYSQVSLQSAGIAVGFNYNFNSFSKPK
ncbi:hypothetical protein [Mucilaginibacter sp.]|jgi:hypothetical protein|uniref:hypothetical protein n=1 Tax=Mucilaginibacter sp. TaxID=1882438 RepID=UPI0035673587